MQYASLNPETLREQFDARWVFPFAWTVVKYQRTNCCSTLTPQMPTRRTVGGYTHKWGRRNGPLASLGGSVRFARSLLLKSVSNRHFHICRSHRTSFVHFLFGSSCLPQNLAVGISVHILFMWCVPYEFAPKPGPR
jgi:hypothetical protein